MNTYENIKIQELFGQKNFQDMESIFLNDRSIFLLKLSIICLIGIGFPIFLFKMGIPGIITIIISFGIILFLGLSIKRRFVLFPIWIEMVADKISNRIRYNPNATNIMEDFDELSNKYPNFMKPFGEGVVYKFDGIEIDDMKTSGIRIETSFINTRVPSKKMINKGIISYKDLETFQFIGIKYGKNWSFLDRRIRGIDYVMFFRKGNEFIYYGNKLNKYLLDKINNAFINNNDILCIVIDNANIFIKKKLNNDIFPESISLLPKNNVKDTMKIFFQKYAYLDYIFQQLQLQKFW